MNMMSENMLVVLSVGIVTGVLAYYFICKLFKLTAFEELDVVFKKKLNMCF
jgi:hypothetical protein